jgi:hypothetical protein
MNLNLVQILIVVANIQVRILKVEVEKGFMRTAVDHELVGPKLEINLVNDLFRLRSNKSINLIVKGKLVKILILLSVSGDTNESRDVSDNPRESYLFLLTTSMPLE